jgi:hypothetical protein
MIPVQQTKVSTHDGKTHGNCFAACVASLLEVGIEKVPAFEDSESGEWFQWLWDLLRSNGYEVHGCRYLGNRKDGGVQDWPANADELNIGPGVDGCYIVGGASPRGFVRGHCVIYKDGRMIHDPHPSGAGLNDLQEIYLIQRSDCEDPHAL